MVFDAGRAQNGAQALKRRAYGNSLPDCKIWLAQADDFGTFISEFLSVLPQVETLAGPWLLEA
jgi:hypothetical protein